MEQVEIHLAHGQQLGVGQAGAVVFGGAARDRQGGLDRGPHCRQRKVRAAGVTATLAEI